MNAWAADSYDGFLDDFLQQLAAETDMLEASIAQDDRHGALASTADVLTT